MFVRNLEGDSCKFADPSLLEDFQPHVEGSSVAFAVQRDGIRAPGLIGPSLWLLHCRR